MLKSYIAVLITLLSSATLAQTAPTPVPTEAENYSIEKTPEGNFYITTNQFSLTLSPDGEVKKSTDSGGAFSDENLYRQENSMPTELLESVPGKLESHAIEAFKLAMLAGIENIHVARMMDQVSGEEFWNHGDYQNSEVVRYLIHKGVSSVNVDNAYKEFLDIANTSSRTRSFRIEQDWKRITVSLPQNEDDIGPAERIGRSVGPAIGRAGAAAIMYELGLATLIASELSLHPRTVQVGVAALNESALLGEEMVGRYGEFIDETGSNAWMFSIDSASPLPDRSVLESFREAFSKMWDE